MATCPVCSRDVTVADGVIPVHYNSGLLRCDASNQPAHAEPKAEKPKAEEPVKKAPAKKAAKKAPAKR